MTKSQRKLYLALHGVREMANGLLKEPLPAKSKASARRIIARCEAEMQNLGPLSDSDRRAIQHIADKLRQWAVDDISISHRAWIAAALEIMDGHRATLPTSAAKIANTCGRVEGMLHTLYTHVDPDLNDFPAMDTGQQIGSEYLTLVRS